MQSNYNGDKVPERGGGLKDQKKRAPGNGERERELGTLVWPGLRARLEIPPCINSYKRCLFKGG